MKNTTKNLLLLGGSVVAVGAAQAGLIPDTPTLTSSELSSTGAYMTDFGKVILWGVGLAIAYNVVKVIVRRVKKPSAL